jgi:uncharacterized membrane protein YfcA
MLTSENSVTADQRPVAAFSGGALIGILGGLIGLGGAEFRLPLLIGLFRFRALEAIILNKAMSLIVVLSALVFRTRHIPLELVSAHIEVVLNLLAGSLLGAWFGASWATRLHSRTLYRLIAVLLVGIAVILAVGHGVSGSGVAVLSGWQLWIAGTVAGFAIGVVASLMGVAGGELLIPTFVLLFGLDIKLAGSLSLCVSLPTMLVGFTRYSRDRSFEVLRLNRAFVVFMVAGSVVGALVGGLLLGLVSASILYPGLALILLLSAIKVWRHE